MHETNFKSGIIVGNSNGDNITRVIADTFNISGSGFPTFIGRSARGTSISPSGSKLNDELVRFAGIGRGSTGYSIVDRAYLSILAGEDWTDIAQGTRLGFSTTTPGGIITTEKLRIFGDSGVVIGNVFNVPTGTVSTIGTIVVIGVGTNYTKCCKIGDTITSAGQTRTISTINSDTNLLVSSMFTPNLTGSSYVITSASPGANACFINGNTYVNDSIGIGTTTPTAKLSVIGYMDIIGSLPSGNAANSTMRLGSNNIGSGFTSLQLAGSTDFIGIINRNNSWLGFGSNNIISIQFNPVNSPGLGIFDFTADQTITPTINGAFIGITARTITDNGTLVNRTNVNGAFNAIKSGTLAATNINIKTTNAYSLYLEGAPKAGVNQTITNSVTLGIGSNNVIISGGVTNAFGLTVSAPIGAVNNYAARFDGDVIENGNLTVASISGASNSIVIHDANGMLLDSGVLVTSLATSASLSNYTLLTTTASISGGFNSRIGALETSTNGITGGLTQLDGRFVHLAGNETISGSKTFVSNLKVNNVDIGIGADPSILIIGKDAGLNCVPNDGSLNNVLIGTEAGKNTILIQDSIFIGYQSGLNSNATSDNIGIGSHTLENVVDGNNVAIGSRSCRLVGVEGHNNVAIGAGTLEFGVGVQDNVAIGPNALTNCGLNYSGGGYYNIAIGLQALNLGTQIDNNIAIGPYSLMNMQGGSENIVIGYSAGGNTINATKNMFLGNFAGNWETGDNQFYLGNMEQGDNVGERHYSLMWGTFSGAFQSLVGQQLTVNGTFNVNGDLHTSGSISSPSISGSAGALVTHDASGKLLDSGIIATSLTPLSTTASISGGFNTRIGALETSTNGITGGLTQLDNKFVHKTGNETISGLKTFTNSIVLTATSGNGILLDTTAPTFGWRDIIGQLIPDIAGTAPSKGVFRGGTIGMYSFSNGDQCDIPFHLPHDYALGTDIFVHIHWSHNGTSIAGNAVFGVTSTVAKGFNQAIFPVEKSQTITYATTNIATTPRWIHRVDEIQLSNNGGTGNFLNTNDIEVDSLILLNVTMTTNPTIGGGTPNEVYIFQVDLHYQSTGIPTKNKAPNFYG